MNFITLNPERELKVELNARGAMPSSWHIFEPEHINAINAAIACGRPLLLTGEPGTGKSQLARAAAAQIGAAFIAFVVDSHTQSRDLLWHFDAVARLADAQLVAAMQDDGPEFRQKLAVKNYIQPGPLWWAFDWTDARTQAGTVVNRLFGDDFKSDPEQQLEPEQLDGGDPNQGCVVLIDEIDKAELLVPNGLLEALGDSCFLPEGFRQRIRVNGIAPLVIISSNNERIMPDAFLRRCLVLNLSLPEDRTKLIDKLMVRGKAHFDDLSDGLLEAAAELVADDRQAAQKAQHRPFPGQAEYIDLLRAVCQQRTSEAERKDLLKIIQPYVVAKGLHSGQ